MAQHDLPFISTHRLGDCLLAFFRFHRPLTPAVHHPCRKGGKFRHCGRGLGSARTFLLGPPWRSDNAGDLYVADTGNNTIRKMSLVGTNWVVTTLAGRGGSPGSTDGTNSAARFNIPDDLAVDGAGNLYVADTLNDTIRMVTPIGTNWVVTTIAGRAGSSGSTPDGTSGSAARFNSPSGVAVDSVTNLYVADWQNNTIRKMTCVGTNWVVTTLAGRAAIAGSVDGTNIVARFNQPVSVAVDSMGSLYVADYGDNTIRKVTPVGTNWVVTTVAGLAAHPGSTDGTGSATRFNYPNSVGVDGVGNVYVGEETPISWASGRYNPQVDPGWDELGGEYYRRVCGPCRQHEWDRKRRAV